MGIPTYVQNLCHWCNIWFVIKTLKTLVSSVWGSHAFEKELKDRQSALEEKVADEQTFAHLFMSDPSVVSVYAAQDESFSTATLTWSNWTMCFKTIQEKSVSKP